MASEEDVLALGKKLEKMISNNTVDHSSALDLLKTLQDLRMTLDVLQKTRIGMIVNNFRKASSEEEVISLAKTLIKSWKKLLPTEPQTSSGKSADSKKESKSVEKDSMNGDSLDSTSSESQKKSESSQQESLPERPSNTTDAVRLKCRELLEKALTLETTLEGAGSPIEISCAIEDAIFVEFKATDNKYKTRVRSRVANLKDSRNPRLRENVLLHYISPEHIARMTAEEMASDDMKQLRAKYTKESIDDHQMAKTGGTATDLFKCGKCLKYNCTYNQVQTRSADEPMTTFVLCNECGNRWKFC